MQRWDQSLDIFDIESRLGRDAVSCEKVIERGTQKLAIDQEFQRNWLFGLEEAVHKRGELVAAEIWIPSAMGLRLSHCISY